MIEDPVYVRPLPATRFGSAGMLAVLVFLAAFGAWELYWRAHWGVPGIVNTDGLWARERRRIDQGEGDRTVLIGSSRTLSNFNLDVWEQARGERPLQLALEGTSPVGVLEQLADDPDFTGELVVGIASDLFFSGYEYRKAAIEKYRTASYSERWAQWMSMTFLEPRLVYLEPDYALFTLLERHAWPLRPGRKENLIPPKLFVHTPDRNARMWDRVEQDSVYANFVKRVWAENFEPPPGMTREEMDKTRQKQIDRAAAAVTKLRTRGVTVTFVRHPTSGAYLAVDTMAFPSARTTVPLAAATASRVISWLEHPELQGYVLPEDSHMSKAQADDYTRKIVALIGSPAPRGRRP